MKKVLLSPAAAAVLVSACGSSGSTGSSGSSPKPVNSKLQNDINTVVAGVQDVQIAIGEVSKGATSDNVEQLAQVADQEHGQLNDMKDQIAIDAPNNNGGYDLTNAVNELKNTMAAIGTYTGNPNPSTEASMVNQYKQAVSDWDNAVGENIQRHKLDTALVAGKLMRGGIGPPQV